jgi:hypothetical protein
MGISNPSISNCGHLAQIFLTLSFPTTRFPKLILFNVPQHAFNNSSTQESGMHSCLSRSRIDKERSGDEEGSRISVTRRERNEVELGKVGARLRLRRESRVRWRRFGRRGCGVVRGLEAY